MATLVKLRGLTKGFPSVNSAPTGAAPTSTQLAPTSNAVVGRAGVRVPVALGTGLRWQGGNAVKALVSTAIAGANNDLTFTANYGGAWGNNVRIIYTSSASGANTAVVTTLWNLVSGVLKYDVSVALDTTNTTANTVRNAINAHPEVSQFIVATNAGGNDGSGAAITVLAATALATGADGTTSTSEKLWAVASGNSTVVVDVDDVFAAKVLRRAKDRFISLGLA